MGNSQGHCPKKSKPSSDKIEVPTPSTQTTESEIYNIAKNVLKDSVFTDDSWMFLTKVRQIQDLQSRPQLAALTDREEAVPAFEDWCSANRIKIADGVKIAKYSSFGLGLQTVKPLKQNEMAVVVPYDAMLSSKMGHAEFNCLVVNSGAYTWRSQVSLALKLLSEALKGTLSIWKPYIDVLPKNLAHPIFFTTEEFAVLESSPCFEDGMKFCRQVVELYGLIFIEVYDAWQRGEQYKNLTPMNFTLETFQWSFAVALTRSLSIQVNGESVNVMVPYWDLCNNGPENLYTHVDVEPCVGSEPALYAYALSDLQQGVQLMICYRDSISPAQFFTIWGIADVKYYAHVRIRVSNKDRNYLAKRSKLGVDPVNLTVFQNEVPLNAADLKSLLIITATTDDLKTETISETTWHRAWAFLSKRISQHLQRYQVDRKLINPNNLQMGLARRMIDCEIAVLQKALEASNNLLTYSPKKLGFDDLYCIQNGSSGADAVVKVVDEEKIKNDNIVVDGLKKFQEAGTKSEIQKNDISDQIPIYEQGATDKQESVIITVSA